MESLCENVIILFLMTEKKSIISNGKSKINSQFIQQNPALITIFSLSLIWLTRSYFFQCRYFSFSPLAVHLSIHTSIHLSVCDFILSVSSLSVFPGEFFTCFFVVVRSCCLPNVHFGIWYFAMPWYSHPHQRVHLPKCQPSWLTTITLLSFLLIANTFTADWTKCLTTSCDSLWHFKFSLPPDNERIGLLMCFVTDSVSSLELRWILHL